MIVLKIRDYNILYYINLNINKFIKINHGGNVILNIISLNDKLEEIGYIKIILNFHNIIET